MFLLPRRLRALFKKKKGDDESRIFLQDEQIIMLVKKVAEQQGRSEEEVITDFTKAGWNQLQHITELEERWDSLSHREQQVVALICLGHRNYQIAEILVIAPETVKTHLQNIFDKFNLRSSRELRLALRDWNFAEWWEQDRQA
ncbi:helix-turn-helix transcriptional regulator [Candidatus Villigracilis saccharophilus]|uniref:response regulator transcription factor n=1 Tax=Candidatus Villigracilis saccharophilus TaxID=3140684 RepID=UPI003134D041|nr:helix-turn-helix transcriptional regulator [Anaerolineales bacterium]